MTVKRVTLLYQLVQHPADHLLACGPHFKSINHCYHMQINHYHDFMDYWEHLAAVSEVSAPPEYATVVVVENLETIIMVKSLYFKWNI